MFDLLQHNEIINHLHSISFIYSFNRSQTWVQILCPYCDDKIRHSHINHGHFYVAKNFPICHCFRCDITVNLKRLLLDTKFQNIELLKRIFKTNSAYSFISEDKSLIVSNSISNFDKIKYLKFYKYLESRILNFNLDKFKIYPSYDEKTKSLLCNFNNYHNEFSISRIIESETIKGTRYIKNESSNFYYFQNPFDYNEITICEGPFDIINIYNFSNRFNNSCFFSINGKGYIRSIINIISEFYLTNYKIKINIIVDKDVLKNINNIIKYFLYKTNKTHSNINVFFYKPSITKDVSELLLIEEIEYRKNIQYRK